MGQLPAASATQRRRSDGRAALGAKWGSRCHGVILIIPRPVLWSAVRPSDDNGSSPGQLPCLAQPEKDDHQREKSRNSRTERQKRSRGGEQKKSYHQPSERSRLALNRSILRRLRVATLRCLNLFTSFIKHHGNIAGSNR